VVDDSVVKILDDKSPQKRDYVIEPYTIIKAQ
jgi:hypothetical protein